MNSIYKILINDKNIYCVVVKFKIIKNKHFQRIPKDRKNNYRILYADDSFINLKVFEKMFSNHTVKTTMNLDNALELLKNEKYDFCFLDNIMGDFRGTNYIEEASKYSEVALLTGSTVETKFKIFLKPFDKELMEGWMNEIYINDA